MKKIISVLLLCIFALNFSVPCLAIDINDSSVYFKQTGKYCTLDSMAMIFRRKAILDGNENWRKITESTMLEQGNWPNVMAGSPVYYDVALGLNMKASSKKLYNDSNGDNGDTGSIISTLKTNLDAHPEGIVLYVFQNGGWQHAVALTGYDSAGNFYCADPGGSSSGIINLMDSILVDSNHANTSSLSGLLKHSVKIWWVSNSSNESNTEEPETPKTPGKPTLKNMNSNYWSKENITFSWNSTANTTHYNLYITKYNGSSYAYYENVFYAESGLTKQLSPGNYRILLQATNSNYYTDDSSNWLYTDGDYVYFTVFDKPEKPVLKSLNSNYWSKENITFSWDSTANTTHYNLYITKYNGSSYAYYENVFYAESGLTKQLSPGEYRVQIQSTNSNYWEDSTWIYTDGDYVYFTVFDKPQKPVLKNINSLYQSNENITFSWETTEHTTHYNLYITKHNGSSYAYYENVFYAESGLTKQLSPGEYRVQIQSTNSNYWEDSTWIYTDGDYVYFTVFDKPEKPVLKNVKDTYNTRENITFSWDTSKTATHYSIFIDTLIAGEYTRTKTIHYAESGTEQYFAPGKYRAHVTATNSNYWTDDNSTWLYSSSDWVYFSVIDKETPYSSSSVTKNENILTIYTELYNLTAPYEIIIVGYKDNRFVTMERGQHNEQNSPYILEGDIDKIKVIVWSDLSTLKPLCEAEEIISDKFIIE